MINEGRISYVHPKVKRNAENDAVDVINLLYEVIEKWWSVGQYYKSFEPVPDEQVIKIIQERNLSPPTPS